MPQLMSSDYCNFMTEVARLLAPEIEEWCSTPVTKISVYVYSTKEMVIKWQSNTSVLICSSSKIDGRYAKF